MIPTSEERLLKRNAVVSGRSAVDRRFPQPDLMPRNVPHPPGVEDNSPAADAARQNSAMVSKLSDLECPPMRPVTGWIDEFRQGWQGISRPSWPISIGFSIGCLTLS